MLRFTDNRDAPVKALQLWQSRQLICRWTSTGNNGGHANIAVQEQLLQAVAQAHLHGA
jgi:hypothetical protein